MINVVKISPLNEKVIWTESYGYKLFSKIDIKISKILSYSFFQDFLID